LLRIGEEVNHEDGGLDVLRAERLRGGAGDGGVAGAAAREDEARRDSSATVK